MADRRHATPVGPQPTRPGLPQITNPALAKDQMPLTWNLPFDPNKWERRSTSLGVVYWYHPDDPYWRYIEGKSYSEYTKVPWYLIDNPGISDQPSGRRSREPNVGQAAREATVTALEGKISALYGRVRVGGSIFIVGNDYYNPSSYGTLWAGYGLGHGELDSLEAMLIPRGAGGYDTVDGAGLNFPYYGSVLFHFHPGLITPTAEGYYASIRGPGTNYIYPGLGHVAVQYLFQQGLLTTFPQPLFIVKARKLYDPRLDGAYVTGGPTTRSSATVVYSNIAALVIADYLANDWFGLGVGDNGIDWDSVVEAANNHSTLVNGKPRHTINAALMRGVPHKSIIDSMCLHARCRIVPRKGKLAIIADKARFSVYTFNKDTAQPIRGHRDGATSVPTAGKLSFTNPNKDWNTDTIPIETDNAKNGVEENRPVEWSLEWCTEPDEAARQLAYLFARARANLRLTFKPTTTDALPFEPGDHVTYDDPVTGLAPTELTAERITDPTSGEYEFETSLYDPAAFSDAVGVIDIKPTPLLPDPFALPPNPTNIVITPASPTYLGPTSNATLTYTTPATPFFETVEIYREFSSDGGLSYGPKTLWTEAPTSPFLLPPFGTGVGLHRLTFVTRTFSGQRSSGVVLVYQINAANFGQGYFLTGMVEIGVATVGEPSGIVTSSPGVTDHARFFGYASSGSERAAISTNSIWTGSQWNRDNISKPAWVQQITADADYLAWFRAPAGANPASFTELMRLSNAGYLGIGGAPTSPLTVQAAAPIEIFNFNTSSGGTNYIFGLVQNTGGQLALGVVNSVSGSTFIGGGLAYAAAIGSFNNVPFQLFTNSVARVTIDTAGKVGINTSAPGEFLDIAGNITLNHFSSGATVDRRIGIGTTGGTVTGTVHWAGIQFTENSFNHQELHFWTSTSGGGATEKMMISQNGWVGIGQTPNVRLHIGIGGVGTQEERLIIDAGSGTGGHSWIEFNRNSGEQGALGIAGSAGAGIVGSAVNDLFIRSSQAIGFSINGGGTIFARMGSSSLHPGVTFSNDLGTDTARWRSLYAAELRVQTLIAQKTIATIGGRILVGPTTKLTADVLAAATTINVEDNQIVVSDRLYLESAPGGVQQIEFMAVTAGPTGTGPYSYTVTRNLDATGANDWKAGDAVFNTGATGSGFIDIYSVRGIKASSEKGPTIVGNIRNSSTFDDWSPRWAIGNLDGLYGYSGTTFGVAFGVPTAAWVKIDPTNGVRIGYNATTKISLDASGNASFTGSITAASGIIGGWTIGANALTAGSGSNTVGMTNDGFNPAFYAGNATPGSAPFRVTTAGALTATNASITGSFTAGNVSITSNTITVGSANITWSGSLMNVSQDLACTNLTCGAVNASVLNAGNFQASNAQLGFAGTKVLGVRGAAVADATNATDVITQLNAWLARARSHGLIA